jgi:hypothetical protein
MKWDGSKMIVIERVGVGVRGLKETNKGRNIEYKRREGYEDKIG